MKKNELKTKKTTLPKNYPGEVDLKLKDDVHLFLIRKFRNAANAGHYILHGFFSAQRATLLSMQNELSLDRLTPHAMKVAYSLMNKKSPPADFSKPETFTSLVDDKELRTTLKTASWGQQVAFAALTLPFLERPYYGDGTTTEQGLKSAHFKLNGSLMFYLWEKNIPVRPLADLLLNNIEKMTEKAVTVAISKDVRDRYMNVWSAAMANVHLISPSCAGDILPFKLECYLHERVVRDIEIAPRGLMAATKNLDPLTRFFLEIATVPSFQLIEDEKGYRTDPGIHAQAKLTPSLEAYIKDDLSALFPTATAAISYLARGLMPLLRATLYEEVAGVFTKPELKQIFKAAKKSDENRGEVAGFSLTRSLEILLAGPKNNKLTSKSRELVENVAKLPHFAKACLEIVGNNSPEEASDPPEYVAGQLVLNIDLWCDILAK